MPADASVGVKLGAGETGLPPLLWVISHKKMRSARVFIFSVSFQFLNNSIFKFPLSVTIDRSQIQHCCYRPMVHKLNSEASKSHFIRNRALH